MTGLVSAVADDALVVIGDRAVPWLAAATGDRAVPWLAVAPTAGDRRTAALDCAATTALDAAEAGILVEVLGVEGSVRTEVVEDVASSF